ncbi:NADH-quinone oxidoreductase subunit C [Sphingobium sp. B11D3B]|uniref:NADH-quinone oxidoreductase subunit C n=1 Tax=Sphingobium sp. B11D3B TaxID=2940575 RepID=UPI002227E8B5|nr:NADH-quinone oxidoreductase subunit C [Sphingobium sp. B11D3B]MCW2387586.1 NADH-quinone oxidoreductase subunit C [Sphingobium sp. B11D3B]
MVTAVHSAPRVEPIEGLADAIRAALGDAVLAIKDAHFELSVGVQREALAEALQLLRDRFDYQQLMEIAGVDYPERAERFEVCYHLLSVTKNHRLRVKVRTDEDHAVPTVTHLWPVAGWLEREVFDMYGVLFEGNTDLRRILTDYGFKGYPFRKDFPLTGYVELRYSEEQKRVVYEPVKLAQDFRSFDFMSPWEGAQYVLPGDEKAKGEAPGAPTPPPPPPPPPPASASPDAKTPKTTDEPADTGAGAPADKAATKQARAPRAKKAEVASAPVEDTPPVENKPKRTRKPKTPEGDA